MLVPGFLEGLDLFDSEVSILWAVEIKVRFIRPGVGDKAVLTRLQYPRDG